MADESGLFKLCGLWKTTSKDGKKYLSGNFTGNSKILVMENKFKQDDRHPDYWVLLAPAEKKGKEQPKQQQEEEDWP